MGPLTRAEHICFRDNHLNFSSKTPSKVDFHIIPNNCEFSINVHMTVKWSNGRAIKLSNWSYHVDQNSIQVPSLSCFNHDQIYV